MGGSLDRGDWRGREDGAVTLIQKKLAETCLGHVTGSEVEQAYRRTDLLEKRRVLMERWRYYVTGNNTSSTLPLRLA